MKRFPLSRYTIFILFAAFLFIQNTTTRLSGSPDIYSSTVSVFSNKSNSKMNATRRLQETKTDGGKADAAENKTEKADASAKDESSPPKCPSFEYFNKHLTKEDLDEFKDQKFCANVSHECCDDTMLKKLAKWWQGKNEVNNNSEFSRAEVRKQKLQAIAYFTSYFLREHKNFKKWAEQLLESNETEGYCKENAKNFQSLEVSGPDVANLYLQDMNTCWTFINKFQTSILCGSCNPKLQTALDFVNGKIIVNNATCQEIATNCWAMGKRNIEQIYPFLKALENLSRCNYDGKKNDFEELTLVSSGTVIKEMPDTKDKVDGNVCPHLLSFGSETNVNSEGDSEFLTKLYKRQKNLIAQIKKSQEETGAVAQKVAETPKVDAAAPAEKKAEAKPETKVRRLNVGDCKNKVKDYIKDLSLKDVKNDFKTKNSKKEDEEFRKAFKDKINELQSKGSEFDDEVATLLKEGLDGQTPFKYPKTKVALKNLKDLILPALDDYCNTWADFWGVEEERDKVIKNIDDLKWKGFNNEYKDQKKKNKWQKSLVDKLENYQVKGNKKDSESLLLQLKDLEYPTEKNLLDVKKLTKKVLKRVYKKKLGFLKIKIAEKNLKDWLKDFKYDDFKGRYADKEDYPSGMCDKLNDFTYEKKDDGALNFMNVCEKF